MRDVVGMEQSQGFLSKAPLTWDQLWARRVTLHEMAPLYRAPRAITPLADEVGIVSHLRGGGNGGSKLSVFPRAHRLESGPGWF